ncbi:MAG: DUF4924 family protein [Paludibacteraceae bacterium]
MKNKRDNIAEYILWIWQLEDYVRAFPDAATDNENPSPDMRFLAELSEMMHREGVTEQGHVQLARNAMAELEELHHRLLDEDASYRAAMIRLTPALNILKSKTDNPLMSDIEAGLTLLYQVLMLRLQHKEITPATAETQTQVTRLLQFLSKIYRAEKVG